MEQVRTRRVRLLLGALIGILALLLTACPEDIDEEAVEDLVEEDETPGEETPVEETPGDEAATDIDVDEEVAAQLDATCTNEQVGYEVDHPGDWVVGDGGAVPECSLFDPEDVTLPDATEIPREIAIVIRETRVEFATATDIEGDETVNELSREEVTVDGRDAVALELESTGEGLYPEGDVHYAYYVDLEPFTLTAVTYDVEDAQPSYEERRDILDAMMASLTFVEEEPDEDEGDEDDEA